MKDEPDPDPPMTDLLRQWARDIAARKLTGPSGKPSSPPILDTTSDLQELRRKLDDVDARRRRKRAWRWWLGLVPLAAAIILLVTGPFSRRSSRPPTLTELGLSMHEGRVRDEAISEFGSGDPLYVHFESDRPGYVFVADFHENLRLMPLGSAVRQVSKGANVLGPFVLDDEGGREAFLVLGSATLRQKEDFVDVLDRGRDAAAGVADDFDLRLDAIARAIREDRRIQLHVLRFLHL